MSCWSRQSLLLRTTRHFSTTRQRKFTSGPANRSGWSSLFPDSADSPGQVFHPHQHQPQANKSARRGRGSRQGEFYLREVRSDERPSRWKQRQQALRQDLTFEHRFETNGSPEVDLEKRLTTNEGSETSNSFDAAAVAMRKQQQILNDGRKRRKNERKTESNLAACGSDDVLAFEVDELLKLPRPEPSEELQISAENFDKSSNLFDEIVVDVEVLSATGEGLARHPKEDHVYVVPFTLAGERVKAKAPLQRSLKRWNNADLIEVLQPSALRKETTPQCKYFGTCSGCQFQMISYSEQLKHKKTIVEKAYCNFSGLDSSQYPAIQATGGSPLQYAYRTKLTPHFDGPRKGTSFAGKVPPIGFTRKGFRQVMDIESCPIGTPIIQEGLRQERAKVAVNINKYKRGATILLRESTERSYNNPDSQGEEVSPSLDSRLPPQSLDPLPPPTDPSPDIKATPTGPSLTYTHPLPAGTTLTDTKTYTTSDKGPALEQIGAYTFSTRAGSFFQNNNSILPTFLSHVRSLLSPSTTSNTSSSTTSPSPSPPLKYLLDAYCGSGLFALTLSPLFTSVLGIEVDAYGVSAARANATRNSITNCGFVEADAAALFADVPFPAAQTALVIDPPRKGCSVEFLRQLLSYGPRKVVYVSCNVNSQARDVGCLVKGRVGEGWWKEDADREGVADGVTVGRYRYEIESLQGWDFFPQTAHVEGLCVLRRVENEAWKGKDGEADV